MNLLVMEQDDETQDSVRHLLLMDRLISPLVAVSTKSKGVTKYVSLTGRPHFRGSMIPRGDLCTKS